MEDANLSSREEKSDTRCPHCAGPLTKEMDTSAWTIPPLIRDSFSMIGSAVGGTAGAFYGFNHAMPIVRRWIKGPMWLHFLIGAPPVIVFSWVSRWFNSSTSSTCIVVLSFRFVISTVSTFITLIESIRYL